MKRFLAALLFPGAAQASGIQVDVLPNFAGAGLGVTTQWMGSKDKIVGLVPGGRMQLENNRFVELYGPTFDMNVLTIPQWEFGPVVSYRFGRADVDDPVVNLLPPIDGGFEAGLYVGWHYVKTEGIPYRLRLGVMATTGVSGGATGANVTPFASLWVPLSNRLFLGFGGGVSWSSDSFMQQRFGVTPEGSAASGLPVYTASAGMRQYYLWPAAIYRLNKEWYAGAGAFYQRITGDGADSPIVTQRGDANQFTYGLGVGYSW
ncbi:MAG TPA: MipA/OmpV family protein [Burkholderiales bacterium]|jgi:outer membrane protein